MKAIITTIGKLLILLGAAIGLFGLLGAIIEKDIKNGTFIIFIGILAACFGDSLLDDAKKMSTKQKHKRNMAIEKIKYIKLEFGESENAVKPLFEVSPMFSKYNGRYSCFIDSVLMTLPGTKKVIGIYDKNKNALPMNYCFAIEGKEGDDFGFVVIWN